MQVEPQARKNDDVKVPNLQSILVGSTDNIQINYISWISTPFV